MDLHTKIVILKYFSIESYGEKYIFAKMVANVIHLITSHVQTVQSTL